MEVYLTGSYLTENTIFSSEVVETNGKLIKLKNPIYAVSGIAFQKVSIPLVENTIDVHNRYISATVTYNSVKYNFTVDLGNPSDYDIAGLTTLLNTQFAAATPYGTWTFDYQIPQKRWRYGVTGAGVTAGSVDWRAAGSLGYTLGMQQTLHEFPVDTTVYANFSRSSVTITRQIYLSIPQIQKDVVSRINEEIEQNVFQVFYLKANETGTYIEAPENVITYWFLKPINLVNLTVTFFIKEGIQTRKLKFGGEPWFLELIVYDKDTIEHNKRVQSKL